MKEAVLEFDLLKCFILAYIIWNTQVDDPVLTDVMEQVTAKEKFWYKTSLTININW